MLRNKSNNAKLIMETWRRFINEGEVETELETENMVYSGDWIIRQMTNAKEQYKNTHEDFEKNYKQTPLGDGPDGFKIYQPPGTPRPGIVVTPEFVELFDTSGGVVSQIDFWETCSEYEPKDEVSKSKKVYAKQHQGEPFKLETKVEKAGKTEFMIEAPWGGTMTVKLGDVIIVLGSEEKPNAYRIARAEFDQTYEFV